MSDDLENLLVSGKEIDRKLVAEILSPYLRIDKETFCIRPLAIWGGLKVSVKIVLYLLARKAMIALDLALPEESASANEVVVDTGLKEGTARPALRRLLADGILAQTKEQRYYIPNHALEQVKALIAGNT
jgi:hypothetical protein